VKTADLVIAAGSSLEVAPASDLPSLAVANQAKIIIINYEPTYLDPQATLIIRADVAEVLPRIAELVIA
jgi:NAD-dependent deacetylase